VKSAEALVKALEENNVTLIFGLPGYNILDIYDVLRTSSIEHILVKHENAAAVMADAYGRLTGKPGTCLVTAGPGATNTVTGVAGAYAAASPMLHITGHCSTQDRIQPFHGVDDWHYLQKIFAPITKWSRTIEKPEEIPKAIHKAFKIATTGRSGPVHLSIPVDILQIEVNYKADEAKIAEDKNERVDFDEIIKAIASSSKPVIIVGKGVLRTFSWIEATKLAENINAPIFNSRWGRSAIPFNHPLNVGYCFSSAFRRTTHPLVKELLNEADMILTLGLEAGVRAMPDFTETKDKMIIHIYQEDGQVGVFKSDNIMEINVPSLRKTIKEIGEKIKFKYKSSWNKLPERISSIKEKVEAELNEIIKENLENKPIHPAIICDLLQKVTEKDAIFTADIGSNFVWMETYFRTRSPNTFIISERFGSMGFALPAAIAAKKAYPERQVVAVSGDGGMLMTLSEIATAVEQKLDLPIIIMNDSKYGILWKIQQNRYGGRFFAVDLMHINFAECAKALGAKGLRVEDPKDLRSTIEEALLTKGPVIVDIVTNYKHDYYKYRV